MSQSWMGSDFSNNDIAKSDAILRYYDHTLERTEAVDGHKVYTIRSVPKPGAPVVWGMQKLKIRDDLVWLAEEFYDEDLQLVKGLVTREIRSLGGRLFPAVWRMRKAGVQNEYTELSYRTLDFRDMLPERIFTLANLRNPRE